MQDYYGLDEKALKDMDELDLTTKNIQVRRIMDIHQKTAEDQTKRLTEEDQKTNHEEVKERKQRETEKEAKRKRGSKQCKIR